jgi:hypothetical protein
MKSIHGVVPRYAMRNSPPYSANSCQNMKKKGNDGKMYVSVADKNGVYRWVSESKALSDGRSDNGNKTDKEALSNMARRYKLTTIGKSKSQIAERIFTHYGRNMNANDFSTIEPFLSTSFMRKRKNDGNKSAKEKKYIKQYFTRKA